MNHPFSRVQSYSSYSSNINGHQTGSSEKFVAQMDRNGKARGKLYRKKFRPDKELEYTRQLEPEEVTHTLYGDTLTHSDTSMVNRHSQIRRDGEAPLSIFDTMDNLFANSFHSLNMEHFHNDPFFNDF